MNATRTWTASFALLAASVCEAQAPCEVAAFGAPVPETFSAFGRTVALSGDTLVVGQPWHSVGGIHFQAGRAIVFERVGSSWTAVQTINPPIIWSDLEFGASLVLDGDRLFVGSPGWDLPGALGGAVFAYERSSGFFGFPALLAPADQTTNARYGSALELDGDTLVVGDYRGLVAGEARGKVYVHVHGAGGWSLQATLVASDGALLDQFGSTLAFEGDVLLVGAPNADPVGLESGAVYAFERSGGAWAEVQKLHSTTVEDWQYFGSALDLDAGRLFVRQARGAGTATPRVTTFAAGSSGWAAGQVLAPAAGVQDSYFGARMAVEGDTLVLGRDVPDGTLPESGAASVYGEVDGTWHEVALLEPGDPAELLQFGRALALDDDRLLVGAYGHTDFSGRVYELALPGFTRAYGFGVAGANGVPVLVATGCAATGRPFGLALTGGASNAPGLLLTSPKPAAVPLFGGSLWLAPPWGGVLPHALDVDGAAAFPFALDASLAGQAFFAQAGYLDGAAVAGVALTPGLGVLVR